MRKLSTKKVVAVIGVAALATTGTGVAYAYWTTSGNGTGTATTGTSSAFAVTTGAATGGPLTPGGASQTVGFTVTNNNSGVQRLSSVVVTVANADGSAWTAVNGCSAADYSITPASFTAGDIAPGANKTGSVTISMLNATTAQDACKGVTVPLHVAAS